MLKFIFLTQAFYDDYQDCKEIECKLSRPHVQISIDVGGVLFCVPMRSNITHPNAFLTDVPNKCGLDFSKAVVITNQERYLNTGDSPFIRPKEFEALRGKDFIIKKRLIKYISDYKKAKANLRIPRNRVLVKYSTLQYFEDMI